MIDMALVRQVIDFWFGPEESPERGSDRKIWWKVDERFDADVRRVLGPLHDRAATGDLDEWIDDPIGCVALIVLLDQVSRNLFRGSPRSWTTDDKAQAAAKQAVKRGLDEKVPVYMRVFLYMPYEHSESLADQQQCIRLMRQIGNDQYDDYARRHLDIISRFGRFPHRNAILGRESTPEERAFLKRPGSSF